MRNRGGLAQRGHGSLTQRREAGVPAALEMLGSFAQDDDLALDERLECGSGRGEIGRPGGIGEVAPSLADGNVRDERR
jgi:hypothetical protein